MQNVNIDSTFISKDNPDFWGFGLLGRIPKKNIPEMGSFIKNGTTTIYDQQESLTYEERPTLINPKRGYIAMTNNKFATDNYVHRTNLH
jgi:acyl-homoserine lactone acylase PvdQ